MAIKRVGPAQPVYDASSAVAYATAGNVLRRWVCNLVPGAGRHTLTGGLVYNLAPRDIILVTHMCFGVTTDSDSCSFILCGFGQPNAVGVVTELARCLHVVTPALALGMEDFHHDYYPPVPVRYSSGVRSISIRVNPNDAACEINVGWAAIKERE